MTPWAPKKNNVCWKSTFLAQMQQPIFMTRAEKTQALYNRIAFLENMAADMRSLAAETIEELSGLRTFLSVELGYDEDDVDATIGHDDRFYDQVMAERLCRTGNTADDPIDVDKPHLPFAPAKAEPTPRKTKTPRAPKKARVAKSSVALNTVSRKLTPDTPIGKPKEEEEDPASENAAMCCDEGNKTIESSSEEE